LAAQEGGEGCPGCSNQTRPGVDSTSHNDRLTAALWFACCRCFGLSFASLPGARPVIGPYSLGRPAGAPPRPPRSGGSFLAPPIAQDSRRSKDQTVFVRISDVAMSCRNLRSLEPLSSTLALGRGCCDHVQGGRLRLGLAPRKACRG